jgi:hypothetical protein
MNFQVYVNGNLQLSGDNNYYLNDPGYLLGQPFMDSGLSYDELSDLIFGSNSTSYYTGESFSFFEGEIDDIAIYNRALTQEEITSLYTGEPANPPAACNPLPSNLQNGLVGYWPFCGNANDESGNGNDGTVNGANLTEDRFGESNAAYDFDGVDDFIEVADDNSLDISNQYSFSLWVKLSDYSFNESPNSPQRTMLAKPRNAGGGGYSFRAIEGYDWGSGNILSYNSSWNTPDANGGLSSLQDDILLINSWTNLIFTYDGTFAKLYNNGNLVNSGFFNISFPNSIEPLFIGKEFNYNLPSENRWFKGSLDDIGIWNRALSAEEVQELYTLNACTFTIYDTVTVNNYVTVYDTVSVSTTDTLIINTLITAVQPAQENTFLVYPNPANTQITIDNGNWSILGGYTIRIVNSAAQEVYNAPISHQTETILLNGWGGNGLYVLYIFDPQQQIVAVKQIVLE